MQTSDIIVYWPPEDSGRVSSIQIQSRIAGTTEWTEQAAAYDAFVGEFRFTSNAPATDVEVRCRYRMVTGLYGPWLSDHIVTSDAKVNYDTIVGVPTSLNDINEGQGGKLDGVEDGATYGAPGNSPVGSSTGATVVSDISIAKQGIAAAHTAIDGINTLTTGIQGRIDALVGTYGDTASAAASASAAAQHEANAQAASANAEAARAGAQGSYESAFTQAGNAETFRNQASTYSSNAQGHASTASEQAGLAASARQSAQDAAYASNVSAGTASSKADAAGQSAQAAQSAQVRASTFALDAAGRATNNIVGRSTFDERGKGNWEGEAQVLRDDGAGGFYILQQTNRDVSEGEFIPGDWSARRFRISGNAAAYGAYIARAGLQCLMQDGSHQYYLIAAGGPHWGYADFSGEFVLPTNVVAARPFLQSDGPWDAGNHGVNWRRIRIEDISAQKAAEDFADAASTSYSNAEIKAGEAGQYAQAASGYANTAEIKAGAASISASAAEGSASVATDKASAAATSASLSAQFVGGGNLAPNTEFTGGETVGWINDRNGAGAFDNIGVNLPGDDWHPVGENVLSIRQSNRYGDSNSVSTLWRTPPIPARVGEWYQTSAYVAGHRCEFDVVIAFMNPAGQWIDAVASPRARASGGMDANSFIRIGVPARQAPAGTVSMTMQVRKYDTDDGQSDSWMWLWRPYVGAAREGQTDFNHYSPGSTRGTVESAKAKIETVASVAADATSAVATRVDTLETSVGGPNGAFARLRTVEEVASSAVGSASAAAGAAANAANLASAAQGSADGAQGTANAAAGAASNAHGAANAAQGTANAASGAASTAQNTANAAFGRVSGASWSKVAETPNGRSQLTVYAYDSNGNTQAGVDIIGDLSVSGNVLVGGSVYTDKVAPNAITSLGYFFSETYSATASSTSWEDLYMGGARAQVTSSVPSTGGVVILDCFSNSGTSEGFVGWTAAMRLVRHDGQVFYPAQELLGQRTVRVIDLKPIANANNSYIIQTARGYYTGGQADDIAMYSILLTADLRKR